MHLILTGATGLVGSGVLDAMIKMKDVTKISVISRRPVKMAEDAKDPRINVIVHKDFNNYNDKALLEQLKGATGCVWALGISQTKVDKEEYVKITKDYAISAAKAFQDLSSDGTSSSTAGLTKKEPFNFIYVSGVGATFQPGLLTPFFGRVKGETELDLAALRRQNPNLHAITVRPAAVDPLQHDAILPYLSFENTPALNNRLLRAAVGLTERWFKSFNSPTEGMGKLFTDLAMGRYKQEMEQDSVGGKKGIEKLEGGFMVLENSAIRRLGGMD